jgi:hypothetical protein
VDTDLLVSDVLDGSLFDSIQNAIEQETARQAGINVEFEQHIIPQDLCQAQAMILDRIRNTANRSQKTQDTLKNIIHAVINDYISPFVEEDSVYVDLLRVLPEHCVNELFLLQNTHKILDLLFKLASVFKYTSEGHHRLHIFSINQGDLPDNVDLTPQLFIPKDMLFRAVRVEREFPGLEDFIARQKTEYLRELAIEVARVQSKVISKQLLSALSYQTLEEEPAV